MENQPPKIKGYRNLSKDEISVINECKELGETVKEFCDKLHIMHNQTGNHAVDPMWLNEAELTLKKGIMFLVRSIAKPESF